jgi:hypothetical protein
LTIGIRVADATSMMKLELRLAQRCITCEQLIDPIPHGVRPRDPLTGMLNIEACIAMSLCPACCTFIEYYPIDWPKLMSRYRRRHRIK